MHYKCPGDCFGNDAYFVLCGHWPELLVIICEYFCIVRAFDLFGNSRIPTIAYLI